MCRRVLQIHKIVDKKTPPDLLEKLPPSRMKLINLPFIFQEIKSRTDRYRNSFFPDAIISWNNIVSYFENLPTFDGLKDHILSLIRPSHKCTFGLHDPSNIRYLFQLRVGLNQLRSHKKYHNFLDTPSDKCLCKQGIEDTKHFLLLCPFYATHREALVNTVNRILRQNDINVIEDYLQLYFYGHSSLSHIDNHDILTATIQFIKNTNRLAN